MLFKSKVKYIQSLSHKRQRDKDGVFVAEGPKIINELLSAKEVELVEIYAVPAMIGILNAGPSKVIEIDNRSLETISFLSTPNQVLGIFRKPVSHVLNFNGSISIMLDNIQDPGNMGSIVRCADWFGVKQIICSKDCADVFSPKTVQSTMGSIARVHVVYDDLARVLTSNPAIHAYAATLEGQSIYETGSLKEGIIVIGNESKGISPGILSLVKNRITIPRKGKAESLNAAVAAGIILSHLVSRS
ncbi:MAG: RNA methyltransferase [Chitinophagaceae bacterium]|nr:RNA methyltransferase [Chitinophagaceae bacterium]